jgi:hypothetical protein
VSDILYTHIARVVKKYTHSESSSPSTWSAAHKHRRHCNVSVVCREHPEKLYKRCMPLCARIGGRAAAGERQHGRRGQASRPVTYSGNRRARGTPAGWRTALAMAGCVRRDVRTFTAFPHSSPSHHTSDNYKPSVKKKKTTASLKPLYWLRVLISFLVEYV